MSKGIIFNIEEFAVHDGPGIRKIVFFKGCPLRCTWCHNPEGMSFRRELMVSYSSCINCGRCKIACRNQSCIVSGDCVDVCPLNIRKISGEEYETEKLAEKLLRGIEAFTGTGGGITISGGEPLAQPEFLLELMRNLKPAHIVVETSGYSKPDVFTRMVSLADLVLMDIKHTDPDIHRKYTGADNLMILENLKYLCQSETEFCIRIPLIPGVNDSRENMEMTAFLIKDAASLRRVELLPYNRTAGAKYSMLKRDYNPLFDESAKINIYRDVFEKNNIKVTVL